MQEQKNCTLVSEWMLKRLFTTNPIGTSSHMQHASRSVRDTSPVWNQAQLWTAGMCKIFRVKTHKYRLTYLGSTVFKPRIPFRLRGIDSRCTESSRHSRAERHRSSFPWSLLLNNTLNASSTPRYLITWCIQVWLEHTYIYTHLEVWSRSPPPARLLENGGTELMCVCLLPFPALRALNHRTRKDLMEERARS